MSAHIRDANARAFWERMYTLTHGDGTHRGDAAYRSDTALESWLTRFGDEQARDDWEQWKQRRAAGNESEAG